jgi:hypothetical protein
VVQTSERSSRCLRKVKRANLTTLEPGILSKQGYFCAREKRVLRLASARSKTSVEREALDGRTGPKLHGSITTQLLLRPKRSFAARGGEGMDTRWA